jgi:hypothetical protein
MTQVVENLSSKEEALSSILSTGKKCSNQVETHFTFVSSSLARASPVFLPITRGQEVHCPLLSSSFPWASISVPVSSRSGFQVSPCFLTYLIRTHWPQKQEAKSSQLFLCWELKNYSATLSLNTRALVMTCLPWPWIFHSPSETPPHLHLEVCTHP